MRLLPCVRQMKRADPDMGNTGPRSEPVAPFSAPMAPAVTNRSMAATQGAMTPPGLPPSSKSTTKPPQPKATKAPAPGAGAGASEAFKPKPVKALKTAFLNTALRMGMLKTAFSLLPGPPSMSAADKLKGIGTGALDELGTQIEAMETRPIPMLSPLQQRENSPSMINQHPAQV